MMAPLHQSPPVEYQHLVGALSRCQSMSDRDRGPSLDETFDRLAKRNIESGIHGRSRLVENQQIWGTDPGPHQCHKLPLPRR